MKLSYIINGIDITNLVYDNPNLIKKVGKRSKIYTNNLTLSAINENNIFSPENEASFLYEYREDYSKIIVEVKDQDITIWKGVLDDIDRKEYEGTVIFTCVESIIKILSAPNFIYYALDGYVGNKEYAGNDAAPSKHMLALLRRYLPDENIDIGSFKILSELQENESIGISCGIISEDKVTPMQFLSDLLMDMGYFIIVNNKISVRWYENFTGDFGIQLSNEHIIKINSIEKEIQDEVYYSYAITYDNSGTPLEIEGSFGDNGTSTDTTSTVLTDSAKEWGIDQWKDKYIFIGTGATKEILKIIKNNKTKIYFQDCTKSGAQVYVIIENDKIYQKDFSDYPIKLSSGASALGTYIISKAPQSKLKIELEILDIINIDLQDSILLNLPNEGINFQSFSIEELQKNLEEKTAKLICLDNSIYPILEAYQIVPPGIPINLTGSRVELDGSAIVSWNSVPGASYYKIYYGVSGKTWIYTTPNNTNINIIDHLEKWLGYYFWVSAVNFYGIEGEYSESLYLAKIPQASGYIDGSNGYLVEKYIDWGLLEDYHYLLTYKNIGYSDIGFLLKCPFEILDSSQSTFVEEISQPFEDQQAAEIWGSRFRRLGYIDGAGTSTYLPEFVNSGGVFEIRNPMSKKLTLNLQAGKITIDPGAIIPSSEDWYLHDGLDIYYTYWYQTGMMMDIAHPDLITWFKTWKINKSMGIWESGNAGIINNETTKIGVLTDVSKSWNINQWEDYYIGVIHNTVILDIEWYKIISNTINTITFDYGDDDLINQQYIINNEPYTGFHGLFMDDVWTSIYREGVNMSIIDDGIAETVTTILLTDNDKTWEINHWAGFYVKITGQSPILILSNTSSTLSFSGNPTTGSNLSYQIKTRFEVMYGVPYADKMADFIETVVEHVENNSYNFYRNWNRCEKGIFMLNTWPDIWSYYSQFVAAVNKRFQHFIMFEALQMTWNMANEVTKQFIILDWHESISRFGEMKVSGGVGNARLAILGYPYNQQAMITHLAGSYIVSNYSNNTIEDITASGNIVLDQLYYDMLMAGNVDNNKTIGFPEAGYETTFIQSQFDRYGIIYRKFEGCHIFYNPSRQFRTLEYMFSEDVVDYFTGQTYGANSLYTFIFPPRTPIFFFRNSSIGEDAYNYLFEYFPYTYIDFNMAWIVFTDSGVAAIGTNSVWISNGYTGNKRFVLDGSQSVPDGEPERLFHAGDGISTYVNGHTPDTEEIIGTGIGTDLVLTSLTILGVVKISSLIPGIDYLIEQKEWDNSESGKGKWKTYIHFLTDQTGVNLTVYYFEQGLDGEGWPQTISSGSQIEHGVLYRNKIDFSLKTGDIDEEDCVTPLVEGVDYYIVPELVRHKWDYRMRPYGDFTTSSTFNAEINLNMIYAVGGNANIKGIHWGIIDAENAILINANGETDNSINGKKAIYSNKTILRPKILIYGFTATPRDTNLDALAPVNRTLDQWSFEFQMKKYLSIYYDAVYVTGDYDGVLEEANEGQWGSINGMIEDENNNFNDWQDVADYFDVIILNDTFTEYQSGSISGKTQWSSWMEIEDYLLIKNFKKRAIEFNRNVLLIDRRMVAPAFVWWGGNLPIQSILLNKGAALIPGYNLQSDLTDVFGCLYYGSLNIDNLANSSANVYTKAKSGAYIKYSSKFKTDYRIGKKTSVTNHYIFDEEDFENHPMFNVWENGGEYISYIPKSKNGRSLPIEFPENNKLFNTSNLYIKWLNLNNLLSGEGNFERYSESGLNNIVLRREPVLIYHTYNFFNVISYAGGYDFGNNHTDQAIAYPSPILSNYGTYRACFFSKISRDLANFFLYKTLYLRESEDEGYKPSFKFSTIPTWEGYTGHYINAVGIPQYDYPIGGNQSDFGWCIHDEWFTGVNERWYGWFFPSDDIMNWGNVLLFDAWNDAAQDLYPISKSTNENGLIPFKRDDDEPLLEGLILSITKSGSVIVIAVDFPVSSIAVPTPLTEGVTNAQVYWAPGGTILCHTNIDMSSWRDKTYWAWFTMEDGSIKSRAIFGYAGSISWNTKYAFAFDSKSGDDYNDFKNRPFKVMASERMYKLSVMLTDSDNNISFNNPVIAKDTIEQTLTVYCERGVNQVSYGGYVIAYMADEDTIIMDESNNEKTKIANKDVLGGRVSGSDDELGVDIAETFRPEGDLNPALLSANLLDSAGIANKPYSMYHYEYAYGRYIKEFGYEKNSGLIACQEFYAYQSITKPPVVIWPGISEADFHEMVQKHIGTKIIFDNLQIAAGDIIYFYYNSFNDMLRIKSNDIENSINGYHKVGDKKSNDGTLLKSIAKGLILEVPLLGQPMQAPETLVCIANNEDSFIMGWNNPTYSPAATGLRIKKKVDRGSGFIISYINISKNLETYTDTDLDEPLDEGFPYTYSICAYNEEGEGPYSNEIINGGPINTVTGVNSGWQGENSLGVSWTLPSGGFIPYTNDIIIEIQRNNFSTPPTNSPFRYKGYVPDGWDGITISDLDVDTSYNFRIAGRNKRGTGVYSSIFNVSTTEGSMPGGAFSILRKIALALTATNQATLTWNSSDLDATETIQIQKQINSGGWIDVSGSPFIAKTEIFIDSNLTVGSLYEYRIKLINETPWSPIVNITIPVSSEVPNFHKTPWLLYPNDPTKMRIMFQTTLRKTGYNFSVEWGYTTAYGNNSGSIIPGAGNVVSYLITNLTPATKIYYKVNCGSNSFSSFFISAPVLSSTSLTFYTLGDTQENPEVFEKIAQLILANIGADTNPKILLQDGDRVYDASEDVWDEIFFNPSTGHTYISELLGKVPIAGCAHGHDEWPDGVRDNFNRYFPVENLPIEYYNLRFGCTEFFFLQELTGYEQFDAQWSWLEEALSNSTALYKIMMVHAPFYASGYHENDTSMYPLLNSIINQYELPLIFQGHNHNFAHCKVDGVNFLTIGTSGAPLYDFTAGFNIPYLIDRFKNHNWSKIICASNQISVEVHETDFDDEASPKTYISDSIYDTIIIPRLKSIYSSIQTPINLTEINTSATSSYLDVDLSADLDTIINAIEIEVAEYDGGWGSYSLWDTLERPWPYENWHGDCSNLIFQITGLDPETQYRIRVRSRLNPSTYSGYSNIVEIETPSLYPSVPTGVEYDNEEFYYSYSSERVDLWLDWINPAETTLMEIEKKLDSGSWIPLTDTADVETYRDRFYVSAGNEANIAAHYYYRIRAYNEIEETRYYSDWVEFGDFNAQPIPNTDPTISGGSGVGWIGFTWTLIEDGSPNTPWEDQRVERSVDSGTFTLLVEPGKWSGGIDDYTPIAGHTYQYRVAKTSRFGTSTYITSTIVDLT